MCICLCVFHIISVSVLGVERGYVEGEGHLENIVLPPILFPRASSSLCCSEVRGWAERMF